MIKKFKPVFMLFLVFSLLFLLGCSHQDLGESQKDLRHAGLARTGGNTGNDMDEMGRFLIQAKEFHDFSIDFFSLWDDHIEATGILLEIFNSKETSLDEKTLSARFLYEEYERFHRALLQINPPAVAAKAFHHASEAVSKRIAFLEAFDKGADAGRLADLEKEASFHEKLFWAEIEKIYHDFDQAAERLGISGASRSSYDLHL